MPLNRSEKFELSLIQYSTVTKESINDIVTSLKRFSIQIFKIFNNGIYLPTENDIVINKLVDVPMKIWDIDEEKECEYSFAEFTVILLFYLLI